MIEGVHFDRRWSSWADVGYKLLARNVSDIFVMGGRPDRWLLSLSLPRSFNRADLADLASGFAEARRAFGTGPLIGGDTTATAGPAVLSLTLLGRRGPRVLGRCGARPGDTLWVNGQLGWAAAGLAAFASGAIPHPLAAAAHRRPTPSPFRRAACTSVTAAIDVSDGLARDTGRLAAASGVDVMLRSDLPGHDALRATGASDELVTSWQLHGGDDYVALVAARRCPGREWYSVGQVSAGTGCLTLQYPDGTRRPLPNAGYEHRFEGGP